LALELAANQKLHKEGVFDPHAETLATSISIRKGALQCIFKSLSRTGEQHEGQQHIKMGDNENNWGDSIKAENR